MNTSIPKSIEIGRPIVNPPTSINNTRFDADEIAELWATIQWLTERLDALDGGGEDKKKRNTKNQ